MEIFTLNIKRIIIGIFEIFISKFSLIIKHCELKLNNKKQYLFYVLLNKIFMPQHKGDNIQSIIKYSHIYASSTTINNDNCTAKFYFIFNSILYEILCA